MAGPIFLDFLLHLYCDGLIREPSITWDVDGHAMEFSVFFLFGGWRKWLSANGCYLPCHLLLHTCGMMLVTQQKLNFYFSVFWSFGFGKRPRVISLNQAYIVVPWLNASFSCITFVVSQFLAKIEKKSSKTWREIWDFFFDNPGSIFVKLLLGWIFV